MSLSKPLKVWPSMRTEMRCVMGLLFLTEVNLGAEFSSDVCCGDSSSYGFAQPVTKAKPEDLREAWRWRAKWRYIDMPVLDATPAYPGRAEDNDPWQIYVKPGIPGASLGAATAFGRDLLARAESSGVAGRSERRRGLRAQFTTPLQHGIPRLADSWTSRTRYKRVSVGQWKWAGEHINLKEGRVSLIALRRTCRTVKSLGRRVLTLSDNLASIGAFEKGRGVGGLVPLCKRAAAYRLGGEIQWRLRYIERDRNPADADSRLRHGQLTPAEVRTACDASASAPAGQFCIRPPPGLERPPVRLALASAGSEQLHGPTVVGSCSKGSRPRASVRRHAAHNSTLDMTTCTSSSSTFRVSSSTPHITQCTEPIHCGYCLELFAGCARLTEAGAGTARGLKFLSPVELSRGNMFDLSRNTHKTSSSIWPTGKVRLCSFRNTMCSLESGEAQHRQLQKSASPRTPGS